jgi:hypothetical protein
MSSNNIDLGSKSDKRRSIRGEARDHKTEDEARTQAIERAKLENAQREQAIRNQQNQQNGEKVPQKKS